MIVIIPDGRDDPVWLSTTKVIAAILGLAALAWLAWGPTSAPAEEAPVLTIEDIRASLAECRNQFAEATKAYTWRGQDYAANLNNAGAAVKTANATVAALQDTIKQIDVEADAEQDAAP